MTLLNKGLTSLPTIYQKILSKFPYEHFTFCFAYGSGVFKQAGKLTNNPLIDLVFVVKNTIDFHAQNLSMNPSHYSSLKYFGHKVLANVQENCSAKVYYNTLIPIQEENVSIKYGVISNKDLITDLLDWNELYIAGRLHKPVRVIIPSTDSALKLALNQNLYNAVHTALLLLPDTFTEKELYRTITNLSYSGDFRTVFGEDKNKVNNIVEPQVDIFRQLYKPTIKALHEFVDMQNDGSTKICRQDTSPVAFLHHLNQLPRTPQRSIVRYWNEQASGQRQDTEDVLRAVSFDTDIDVIVENSIKDIVWKSGMSQALKGILTAGIVKSVRYSCKKVLKMLESSKIN